MTIEQVIESLRATPGLDSLSLRKCEDSVCIVEKGSQPGTKVSIVKRRSYWWVTIEFDPGKETPLKYYEAQRETLKEAITEIFQRAKIPLPLWLGALRN